MNERPGGRYRSFTQVSGRNLLAGDGSIANDQTVRVPVMDDIDNAKFTGAFVLSADHAWAAVTGFLRHGSAEDLGSWQQL